MTDAPLIEVRNIRRAFDENHIIALDDVSLRIDAGESLAIVGASGSGKSCLVNVMTGIDQPNAGEVLWKGETVRGRRGWSALRRTSIGIVFQEFNLIPTLTALENVEIATFGQRLGAGGATAQARAALESTGLAKRLHHPPHRMSGGERQRVAIARSIVNQPELLVADEPTGNLDSVNAALVADLLFEISRERGMTLVLVTHSEALASRCARRAQMRDGRVAWIGANGQSDAIERARA